MNDLSDKPEGPELVIGLVAAIGTSLDPVCSALESCLRQVNYSCAEPIRLSRLLDEIPNKPWGELPQKPEADRCDRYMDAGNRFRRDLNRGDALALTAVGAIRSLREDPNAPVPRRAYLLRSLKHPDEVSALRRIYGPAFVLLAAYCPREQRLRDLARRIAGSLAEFQSIRRLPEAQQLINRDEAEIHNPFGQNVRKVFPQADFFVDASVPDQLRISVSRIVELLFGNTFHTPTRDEYCMFHAQAAALRSSSLQRQVGAVVATVDGDIVAVGANEVAKAGGGLYWTGDKPDSRDFVLGYETSDRFKKRMLADVLQRLQKEHWLSPDRTDADIDRLVEAASSGILNDAQFMNIIEFGRCVHAEMAALVDAARRGAGVCGSTLYTTTFPCHDCARHIVAAGIKRVVYVEPYPKSLVPELYPDSIAVEGAARFGDQVDFEPFVGVAPRRYMDLFTMMERKDRMGNVQGWERSIAMPRLGEYYLPFPFVTVAVEEIRFKEFMQQLEEAAKEWQLRPRSDEA